LYLILAILEKRLNLRFSAIDVYVNVTGGLKLDEPAADLAIALALISSITDKPIPNDLVAFGELGLSGECRAVSCAEIREKEAVRLGFTKVVLPRGSAKRAKASDSHSLIPVKSVYEVLRAIDN
jgi:DNA repair protein RadA/Sms